MGTLIRWYENVTKAYRASCYERKNMYKMKVKYASQVFSERLKISGLKQNIIKGSRRNCKTNFIFRYINSSRGKPFQNVNFFQSWTCPSLIIMKFGVWKQYTKTKFFVKTKIFVTWLNMNYAISNFEKHFKLWYTLMLISQKIYESDC